MSSATCHCYGFYMVTAVVPNADELIAARQAAGQDRRDEIIAGVYYMVPPSSSGHGRRQLEIGAKLLAQNLPVASEAGVGFPQDYVIPDLVVFRQVVDDDTIYAHPNDVAFVVEIRSDSSVGTHWEAKLRRLHDWGLPVVIIAGDNIENQDQLSPDIVALLC